MDVADARAGPAQRIVETIEAQLDEVVATAVDTIWEQVPAYPASSAPELRRDLTTHVGLVFRALVTSLKEDRPARADDFPVTELQAALRLRQGISLSDFLHAFRIGELTFWEAVLDVAQDDPGTREAALALAGPVMRGIEAGSTVAAEAYLYAQQHELAESDRVRRDLLEDLLHFYMHESCGQCTPCREGTDWLYKIVQRIEAGKGKPEDLDIILDIADNMEGKTICALAAAATMPTRSYVKKFREEFIAHFEHRGCPKKRAKQLAGAAPAARA